MRRCNRVDAELTRLGKWHEFHTYNNAGHAFQNFLDDRYRERASRASWTDESGVLYGVFEARQRVMRAHSAPEEKSSR
jgi:hypothetical protein